MGLSSVSGHWEASKNVLGETWGRSRVGFGGLGRVWVPWGLYSGMMPQVGLKIFEPDFLTAWKRLGAVLEPSWAPLGLSKAARGPH